MTQPTYHRKYIIFLVATLMLLALLNLADKELLAAVAPKVKEDLGLDDGHLGIVRSIVFLAAILGAFVWGPLSDRWKRKNVLALGAMCWSAVTWMTAVVTGFAQLAFARGSMSFFEACFGPSAYSLITDVVPRARRGLIIGLLGITYPMGTIVALIVGGLLGETNWRLPFILFGIPGIILGLVVLAFVRELPRGGSEEAVLESGGAYTGRFSWAELKRSLQTRTLLLIFLLDACEAAVFYSLAFWAPNYLFSQGIADSLSAADFALLPAILGSVCGSLVGGFFTDRLRRRTPLAAALVSFVAMAGAFIIALLLFNLYDLTAVMVVAFFFGLVGYMIFPSVTVMMYDIVPPETKASVMASDGVISGLVSAGASLTIGLLSRELQSLRLAFGGVCLFFLAVGALLALVVMRRIGSDMQAQDQLVRERIEVG